MNIAIVYFSQTGNTQKIAKTLEESFLQREHSVRLIPLKDANPEDAKNCDLLGIGTPCFASQAPTPVKSFLQSLQSLDKKPAFVFATTGGAPGKVLFDLSKMLRSKKADIIGGLLVRGELFHPAPCLNGRFPNRPNSEDLDHAKQFAFALSDNITTGVTAPIPHNRTDALSFKLGFYNIVGYINPDFTVRFLLPKPKLKNDLCDKCEWCFKECPTQNITMDPLPILGSKCIRCYHCMTGCPQDAFRVSWLFANPIVWSLYNTSFEKWFGDVSKNEKIY